MKSGGFLTPLVVIRHSHRLRITPLLALPAILLLVLWQYSALAPNQGVAGTTPNPIQHENSLPGTTAWQVAKPSEHGEIQAYVGLDSVNTGQNEPLYVSTKTAGDGYIFDLYRLGYYGGTGGRLLWEIKYPGYGKAQGYYDSTENISYPVHCPTCIVSMKDSKGQETYITDANWQETNLISTNSFVSGLYVVKLTETNSGYQWEVPFVVRNDSLKADLVYQVPFNTDQAYNTWGGTSLYKNYRLYPSTGTGNAPFWAFYDSYNRPYIQDYGTGNTLVYSYRMARFMEQQGYDVTYTTNNAVALGQTNLLNYKGFISAGHDEYWSYAERQKLESAIANKVNVAFFGGNDMYWQIRDIADTHGNQDRIIVEYKDYSDPHPYDPYDVAGNANRYLTTTLWRAPPVSDPEDKILKTMYGAGSYSTYQNLLVTSTNSWVFKNASIGNSAAIKGILGLEVDTFYPDGSTTPNDHITIIGQSSFTPQTGNAITAYAVLDTLTAGNTVFNGGTIGWSLGLTGYSTIIPESAPLRTMTNNILSMMAYGQPANAAPPSDAGGSSGGGSAPSSNDDGGSGAGGEAPGTPTGGSSQSPASSSTSQSTQPTSGQQSQSNVKASSIVASGTHAVPANIFAQFIASKVALGTSLSVAVLLSVGSVVGWLIWRRKHTTMTSLAQQIPSGSSPYYGPVVVSEVFDDRTRTPR